MKKQEYTEFEAKFYPVNKEEYRAKLKSIGAKLAIPERKMIRIVADWRDNPVLSKRTCIRVRDEGDCIRLSLKFFGGDMTKLSDQNEIETKVDNFDNTVKIFEGAGVKFNRRQENSREEWDYKGVQITIDSWPGLEPYTEIEGNSDESVKEIAELLGFDWNKKLITPISGVYSKVYGIDEDDVHKDISNISFDNPPFKNLKKIWNG